MAAATTTTAAAQEGLRQRLLPESENEEYQDLPYGGKVYLARRKKADPTYVRVLEACMIIGTIAFALYAYFYFDNLHFHVTHGYAHLGYPEAQHQVGQRYLYGKGTEKHSEKAMQWFKKAADQGHAHASYNYAIGHLKGYKSDLRKGDAHKLIRHAASKGVKEAEETLNSVCTQGGCDK
ncbi:secretory immunoglobulin A-binding protein EsiB-like [Liolophura sinensis]|uniref:secretory immunoglobulin A-binding protein EsiB-like n=1 Tax=Liolophura sinensis TaxID=3198878 RepID=UPI0031595C53